MALHGAKGVFSFAKEDTPFLSPRERLTLRDWRLKNCTRCAIGCGVDGFAMSLLRVVTDSNRALLRGARVTVARRRTAVRAAALLRSPLGSSGGNEKRPRQRSFYRLSVRPRR